MKNTIFITMFMAILGCAKNESNDPNPWQRIGFQGTPVTGLVIDANFFVAGTSQGVFVSHDLALSWIEQNSGLDDLSIESVAKDSGGILFVSTGSGIYRSLDSGKTWIASYLHAGSAGWSYMTVSPANVLFATYERRDTALLRSTNQGLSWQPLIWQKDGLRRMTFEVIASSTCQTIRVIVSKARIWANHGSILMFGNLSP